MLAGVVPGPGLTVVRKILRARKQPSLSECLAGLDLHRRRCEAAVILNALDPEAFRRAVSAQAETDEYLYGDDPLIDACLRAINEVAPLDLDAMDMRCQDELPDELYPVSLGYPMSWEEWDEIADNLDTCSPDIGLYIFVTAMRLGAGKVLFEASEHFGWDLAIENWDSSPDPNWDRLFVLLDENGLGVFKHAIDVCLYATGNPYFDYNPWDEDQLISLPAFNLSGVRAMEQTWRDAQPIREDLKRAVLQFAQDANLAQTLVDLYEESGKEQERRPQTLAEIWAGDDGADEPVIDPFYGPIGGQDNDDEWEDETE